ncbi:hypothetical protein PAT3040_04589 [Paenibacillus agaridevorans]|uniref:Uncharacterized protein n=1 Tax=Paenibacillus agaridevorans TaxID=171404 RepID=A0A2R5ET97_9BACL|nr:hypothetical protein PAT3040_04589 [Paenibacillus agaridevorans]
MFYSMQYAFERFWSIGKDRCPISFSGLEWKLVTDKKLKPAVFDIMLRVHTDFNLMTCARFLRPSPH